jgi:Tol biopolymer transport system component
LAYSSDKSGNFEIYVKQLTPGGGEIQLTSDGQQNIQPTWSPDDQHVAYYSIERGGIWVVPAMGGRPKQITSFGSSPSWSPDGSQIAFQSQAPAGVFSSTYYAAMSISTIWECPSGGGEPTQITHAGEPPGGHGAPVWSPDGSRIGFVASDIDLSALWSMDPDGSQLKSLSRPRGRVYEFAYSPDGKHLFCVARTTDRFNLWKVPVEEDSRDPSEAVVLTDATPAVVRQVSVSGDGKKVAWSALSLNANLASIRISPDTYEPEENPVLLTDTSHYRDAHPRFSPDGQKVTFMRWMAGARRQLWLVDANGDNPEPLADTGGLSDWSTDGAQVYFAAWRESGAGIWSIDIDSRKEQFIFKPQIKHFFYRLSSDDRYIAVHSREGGVTNVWTMPVSGGEAQQITFDEEWAAYPCWSPDGKHLAYEFRRGKDIHIAVIPSQGGTPKQLTFDPGLSYVSSFSPDGDKIAFAGERNGIWNVFWVSRIDKKQLQLTSYTARNSYVRYPTWSPRGDQIVYEYAETIGDVWLAEIKE